MPIEKRFRDRYKSGDTPWDAGKPDFNLIETVTENNISSCKALDVGCGTGDNCIWIHGHIHESFDYEIDKTRVVCNPRGYAATEENKGFKPDYTLVV